MKLYFILSFIDSFYFVFSIRWINYVLVYISVKLITMVSGKVNAYYKGHTFFFRYHTMKKGDKWVCTHFPRCKASMCIDDQRFILESTLEHNHKGRKIIPGRGGKYYSLHKWNPQTPAAIKFYYTNGILKGSPYNCTFATKIGYISHMGHTKDASASCISRRDHIRSGIFIISVLFWFC